MRWSGWCLSVSTVSFSNINERSAYTESDSPGTLVSGKSLSIYSLGSEQINWYNLSMHVGRVF